MLNFFQLSVTPILVVSIFRDMFELQFFKKNFLPLASQQYFAISLFSIPGSFALNMLIQSQAHSGLRDHKIFQNKSKSMACTTTLNLKIKFENSVMSLNTCPRKVFEIFYTF